MPSAANPRDRSASRSATGERTGSPIQLLADAKMLIEVPSALVGVEQPAAEPRGVLEEDSGRQARRTAAVTAIAIGPVLQPAAGDAIPITAHEGEQVFALHEKILAPIDAGL